MDQISTDTGRFGIVPEWVLTAELTDRAVRLYATLGCVWADRDDGSCWPSRRSIADRLGCSVDSVDRALRELVELGAVVVEARADEGGQATNRYVVRRARPGREAAAGGPRQRGGGGREAAAGGAATARPELESVELESLNENTASRPAPAAPDPSSREARLCSFFVAELVEADPGVKRPTISAAWLAEADRLFRLDGRDPAEVAEVIRWIFRDPGGSFWIANCRSVPTLRKRYETIRAQMRRARGGRSAVARPSPRDAVPAGEIVVGPKGGRS